MVDLTFHRKDLVHEMPYLELVILVDPGECDREEVPGIFNEVGDDTYEVRVDEITKTVASCEEQMYCF